MTEHAMAPTTHTAEVRQIREINAALARGARPTAGSIGVSAGVARDAVLRRLRYAGPPSYPYIYATFIRSGETSSDSRPTIVELHTAQLRAISNQLQLRGHIWGV